MEVAISERFPSLDPIAIRQKRGAEVLLLIRRLGNYSKKETKNKKKRIQAGNEWF